MKNLLLACFTAFSILTACNDKKESDKKFISVYSLIKSQVDHIDTSLYSIMKLVSSDTLPPDTSYVSRENFATEAKEFLELPDLANPKIAKRFREVAPRYDEFLNRVVFTYLPVDSIKEEYKSIELTITPNVATGDKVRNIFATRVINNRDSFMKKNMLWLMDRSFQVTTILQKPGLPETTTTTKLIWNEEN